MRPLDPLTSIKAKLGAVILAALGTSLVVYPLGLRAGWPLTIIAFVSAVLGLSMVQLLARGMTSPLREMVTAAKAMAKGDYSQKVTATSRDEVGELARAFNAMASELAEVDRMRKDLVANVSHELRTPISALRAVLENLIDGVEPSDPAALHIVLNQVERLGRLVEQLLDLSKLESGGVPLNKKPFEVGHLLSQAARESQLHRSDVGIDVTVVPPDLSAEADAERIHQVVANLLDNAVRHSPVGSRVDLGAKASDGHIEISVFDRGPGIPAAEVARVFERFYRSDSSRSSDEGGTGLGLAIAKWIVDLHGGDIRVESGRTGCRMVVELPIGGSA